MADKYHIENLTPEIIEKVWYEFLSKGQYLENFNAPWYHSARLRPWMRRLPSEPRCRFCYIPFEGIGGTLSRLLFNIKPSRGNPYFCNDCERMAEVFQGGAEVEAAVLFADMRGSTTIAESMPPVEFSRLVNRFYNVAVGILFDTNAVVEKLVGDAVTGFYAPGFSGKDYARVAIDAARQILKATGSGDPQGPWIPVGIGVHSGLAYVGSVTSETGVANIAILGDMPNTGARLAGLAGAGEIYVSQAAAEAAGLDTTGLASQHLTLKGRSQPVDAYVLQAQQVAARS
jgi:adenylate cyclase